ncbi:hypothetical protein SEVIR_2G000600v4 [Setaria viridis]|uniref:DUF4220 domain-containing protein n=1 Tax=Setaria viridis TaxID=4556 RepID=A0A4U6VNM5_SETVI|nr:uncharacterized protein LOC117842322 [Setaria viridis]TKW29973.1 hypothetical protein SEVIR_2G000600v2 [Setaria viridis]
MGFNPPVPQQDSNWEIRAAVQVSLLLQILLIFVGPVRKRSSHPFPRFTVWSCYLLADWVADLALGLLLNNMGNIGGGGSGSSSSSFGLKRGGGGANAGANAGNADSGSSSPIIFAFWTPFLLLHLGGPDTITAYSLEDNELWLRHLIGLLFELFSASVIFFCSLRGNPMIHATVLMFVAGIIKYAERTYSLYSGSVDGFRTKILDPPEPGPNYAKLMTEFDSKYKAGLAVEITIADGEASKAQKQMEEKETERSVLHANKSVEARAYEFFVIFRRLFVNLILSFKERRLSQAFFLQREKLTPSEAFEVIEVELNFIYDMVYTKAPVAHTAHGWVLRCVCSGCLAAALAIFLLLDKSRHNISRVDTGITYALLLGGLALDAVALLMLLFSNRATVFLEQSQRLRWLVRLTRAAKRSRRTRRWSGKTSQLNLIGYCLGKPEHNSRRGRCRWWLKVADKVGLEEIVDDLIFIKRVPLMKEGSSSSSLLDFIFEGLKDAAMNLQKKLEKKEDIMEVCGRRGKGVVEHHEEQIKEALKTHYEEQMKKAVEDKDERLVLEEQIKEALKDDKDKGFKEQIIKALKIDNKDGHLVVLEEQVKEALKMKNKDDQRLETTKQIKEALSNHNRDKKFKLILDSVVESDFDESLLLWHVATDLCRLKDKQGPAAEDTTKMQAIGETLSEYMLYLLIKQPEMLSATAGIGLLRYRDTCAEAQRFFASMDAWVGAHEDARVMLLRVNTSKKPSTVKGDRSKSVLFDAVILAKVLRELDDGLMWKVLTGVWREMLTYAAGKCRGSTHVRQLSRGGELITLVWFLMAHMGLGDMYQIQEGDAKAKLIVNDQ